MPRLRPAPTVAHGAPARSYRFAFGVPISLVLNATHYRALANPPSVGVLAGRDVGLLVAPASAVVVKALVGLHV